MRVYFFRLLKISIYSFLSTTTIICLLMVSIPLDLKNQIKNDLNVMIFRAPVIHSSFNSVLLDLSGLRVTKDDISNYTSCQRKGFKSKRKTIVLVPYRNRLTHLKFFISPLHQQLINQVVFVLNYK